MKANELRLGNWVLHALAYKQIDHLILFNLAHEFEPIPLTEEMMKILGFQLVVEDGLRFWKITANGRTFKSLESILFTWEKYVHNLQNAVFASLQYELEMKNPA